MNDARKDKGHGRADHGADGDYLWSGSGTPNPDVAALEAELGRHRWRGAEVPARTFPWRRALAASVLALAAGWLAWKVVVAADLRARPPARAVPPDAPRAGDEVRYSLEVLAGTPHIEGGTPQALGAGARVLTDAFSRARLGVGDIGSVLLEPESRLRVEEPPEGGDAGHLLYLERGTLTASIFAAPRLFQVGTPSGLAVDLGCIYTAHVDEAGGTRLSVVSGQVSFESEARRVTVPAGASTQALPGRGPGTPTWDTAPESWRAAVARLDDVLGRGAGAAAERGRILAEVLATDRAADSLTLWHLLAWPVLEGDDRLLVCEALQRLAPAPASVAGAACRGQDLEALRLWRDELGWSW